MSKGGRKVIGSTATQSGPALSDEAVQYKLTQKRTVRYQYRRMSDKSWCCWVCGPFHSRTYGVSSFGTNKYRAKVSLQKNLADNYGYIGHLLFSDVDDADNVGNVNIRLLDASAKAVPVTC